MASHNHLSSGWWRRAVRVGVLLFAATQAAPALAQPNRPYIPPPPPSPPPRPYIPPSMPPTGPSPGQQALQNATRQMQFQFNERAQQQSLQSHLKLGGQHHQQSVRELERLRNPQPGGGNAARANGAGAIPRPKAGIVITNIDAKGQGAKVGLAKGDVLVSYDGQKVTDLKQFIDGRQAEAADGPPRELVVWRAGRLVTLRLPPGKLGIVLVKK